VGRWCIEKASEYARTQQSSVLRTAIYTQLHESMAFALTVGFIPSMGTTHPERTYLEKSVIPLDLRPME
jgi:hypothetical protein